MNEAKIRQICEAGGLSVAELRRADDILVVVPDSLDHLPDADALEQLADALRAESSARYVTLGLEEADVEPSKAGQI